MSVRDVPRGNLHDVRKNLGLQLTELDDWIEDIVDYLGAVPPSGLVMEYQWQTATTATDPGSGFIAADTTDPYTVTELYISRYSRNGNDLGVIIEALDPADLLLLFEEPSPFGTSYYEVLAKAVQDVSGDWYTLSVNSSSATGQALPSLLGNDTQFGIIGNPNRYLPEGGLTGWIIHKTSDDNYDVEWVDGDTKFLPQGTQHNDLPGIGPNDHHPQIHTLYGTDHSDVDTGDTPAVRDLLARNEANTLFRLETRANWRGNWGQQTYYKHDMVLDLGYTMIANKETTDRAAPTPVGDPTYTLPEIPPWVEFSNTSVIYSGHLYSFTQTGYFRALRIWVPELSGTTNYRIVLVRNPNSSVPEYSQINDPILNENDWTVLGLDTVLVAAGEELLVYIDAYNSGGETSWAYNWLYAGVNNNDVDPLSGNWQINQQNSQLKINWLDAEALPVDHQLELQVVPNTIFEISEVGNPANFIHLQVQGAYTENLGWTTYNVVVTNTGGVWPPPVTTGTQIRAVQPIAQSAKFVGIDGYWTPYNGGAGTMPPWATIVSNLQFDGIDQPVQGDEAYGVDIAFQPVLISPDWDIVSLTSGGSGEAGNPFPEAPDTGDTYGRDGSAQDWKTVYTRTEADGTFPDEAPTDGRLYGRYGSTRLWEVVYSAAEIDNIFVEEAPEDGSLYGRKDGGWERAVSYEELRSYIDWDVDNTDHTADWGDRTLVEIGPSTITMPVALDADPVDDLIIWNNGSNFTEVTTITPAPGHGFVFNGDTTFDPFTLKTGEMVRVTSRALNLYNLAIEAAAPFNGFGTVGLVPNPPEAPTGKYLSDSGAWQSIVAPPTGGAVELSYNWSTQTGGVPLQGVAYVNNADPSLATEAVIHMTTLNGNRLQQLWQSFQEDDIVWFVDQAGGNTYGYVLDGTVTPNDPNWDLATYVTFGLTTTNDIDGTIPDTQGILVTFLANPAARIPPGGLTGEALVKLTDANFDTTWQATLLDAPNDGWSHARQWNGSAMEWNSQPEFEGPVGIGTTNPLAPLHVSVGATPVPPLGAADKFILQGAVATNIYLDIVGDDTKKTGIRFGNSTAIANGQIAFDNASNAMTFGTVGPERMRITDEGNVGVGTTAPTNNTNQTAVTINGQQYGRVDVWNRTDDAEGTLYAGGNAVTLAVENSTTAPLRFSLAGVSGGEAMRITSAGNVGIGTAAPASQLEVDKEITAGQNSANAFRAVYAGVYNTGWFFRNDGNAFYLMETENNDPHGGWSSRRPIQWTCAQGYGAGSTYIDTNFRIVQSDAEKMRLTQEGKLGIGTASPYYMFEVFDSTLGRAAFRLRNGVADYRVILPLGGSIVTHYNYSGGMGFDVRTNADMFFNTDAARRMTIKGGGNVGIGEANPAYKLEVNGDINLSGAFNYYINGSPIETFVDAPQDGNTYGRNNGNWVIVSGGGGTISNLGTAYASTYVDITNTGGDDTRINDATTSLAGVMSASDKSKLDALPTSFPDIEPGTTVGQHLYWTGSSWANTSMLLRTSSSRIEINYGSANSTFPTAIGTNLKVYGAIEATGDMLCIDYFGTGDITVNGAVASDTSLRSGNLANSGNVSIYADNGGNIVKGTPYAELATKSDLKLMVNALLNDGAITATTAATLNAAFTP